MLEFSKKPSKIKFSDQENESCSISGENDGNCRVFRECESLYSLFRENPKSPSFISLIKSRSCGRNSEGKPLVCCSRSLESTTAAVTTIKTVQSNVQLSKKSLKQTCV